MNVIRVTLYKNALSHSLVVAGLLIDQGVLGSNKKVPAQCLLGYPPSLSEKINI